MFVDLDQHFLVENTDLATRSKKRDQFPIFCPPFTHNITDMSQREPCGDQVHHRRNSLLLNELQHLAKIKTPKLLEISNKGVTNFTQTKAKKTE